MTAPNPVCICGHPESDHYKQPRRSCTALNWIKEGLRRFGIRCDCPGYEVDPKVSE